MKLHRSFEQLIEAFYTVGLNPTDHIQFEVSMAVMQHLVPEHEFVQLKPDTTVIMQTDAGDSIQLHIMDQADEQPIEESTDAEN